MHVHRVSAPDPAGGGYNDTPDSVAGGEGVASVLPLPRNDTPALVPSHLKLQFSPRKGAQQPPTFRPMSIVTKRSPISGTTEHLYSVG